MDANGSVSNESDLIYLILHGGNSSAGNNSSIDFAMRPPPDLSFTISMGICLYTLTAWTVLGNIMVWVALFTNKQLKTGGVSNFLIGNLALSDLLLGLTVLPFSATLEVFRYWPFGKTMCEIWLSIDVLCSTASIWGLCAIAVDRYIATNKPIFYQQMRGKKSVQYAVIYCVIAWGISIIISLPPMFDSEKTSKDVYKYDPDTGQWMCILFETPTFVITSSLGSFYIPLVIMLVLYVRVFLSIRAQSKKLQKRKPPAAKRKAPDEAPNPAKFNGHVPDEPKPVDDAANAADNDIQLRVLVNPPESPEKATTFTGRLMEKHIGKRSLFLPMVKKGNQTSSETRVTKTLAIIMGCFIVCWLPFFSTYIVRALNGFIPEAVMATFFWLGYANSALNPILYAVLNRNFRQAFRDILCCAIWNTRSGM